MKPEQAALTSKQAASVGTPSLCCTMQAVAGIG
jgi:hypothetical protein